MASALLYVRLSGLPVGEHLRRKTKQLDHVVHNPQRLLKLLRSNEVVLGTGIGQHAVFVHLLAQLHGALGRNSFGRHQPPESGQGQSLRRSRPSGGGLYLPYLRFCGKAARLPLFLCLELRRLRGGKNKLIQLIAGLPDGGGLVILTGFQLIAHQGHNHRLHPARGHHLGFPGRRFRQRISPGLHRHGGRPGNLLGKEVKRLPGHRLREGVIFCRYILLIPQGLRKLGRRLIHMVFPVNFPGIAHIPEHLHDQKIPFSHSVDIRRDNRKVSVP